jgi:hypothetical protein
MPLFLQALLDEAGHLPVVFHHEDFHCFHSIKVLELRAES